MEGRPHKEFARMGRARSRTLIISALDCGLSAPAAMAALDRGDEARVHPLELLGAVGAPDGIAGVWWGVLGLIAAMHTLAMAGALV